MISATVLADLASKIPEDARPQMIRELSALDYRRFGRDLVIYLKSQKSSFPFQDDVSLGKLVFAAAFSLGDLWARNGDISRADFGLITSEVIGALQGLSPSERRDRRLINTLDELSA